MKLSKLSILILLLALTFNCVLTAQADAATNLIGKILIQTESYSRDWYVYPKNQQRYYLKDGQTAYDLIKSLSRLVYDSGLARISQTDPKKTSAAAFKLFSGYFLKTASTGSTYWYVSPGDKLRYKVSDAVSAAKLISELGMNVKNVELKKYGMNSTQIAFDQTFNDVAYVKYNGKTFSGGYYADKILPLASLTKLMTALVLLDQKIDWDKKVTITEDEINYPKTIVGDDKTSEIDCAAGDQIRILDLWAAMLLASSNQATVALVDSTAISRDEFVKLMNDKAKSLGLKKTFFYDVTGLNADNVTTAKEMAKIAWAAFDNQKIADSSVLNEYIINASDSLGNLKTINVTNRNYSLMTNFSPDGAKVGYLVEAQRTVAIKKGAKVVVVMHALSMAQRNQIIKRLLQ